jgi:hypothetical protein
MSGGKMHLGFWHSQTRDLKTNSEPIEELEGRARTTINYALRFSSTPDSHSVV